MGRCWTSQGKTETEVIAHKYRACSIFMKNFQVKESDLIHRHAINRLPLTAKPDFQRIRIGWEEKKQIFLFVTLTAPIPKLQGVHKCSARIN